MSGNRPPRTSVYFSPLLFRDQSKRVRQIYREPNVSYSVRICEKKADSHKFGIRKYFMIDYFLFTFALYTTTVEFILRLYYL